MLSNDNKQWFDVASYPLKLDNDRSGCIYILHDITERKRVVSIIHEQKEFLEALIENSPAAMITTNSEQLVLSCNPAFEEMFGYSCDEAVGHNVDQLLLNFY